MSGVRIENQLFADPQGFLVLAGQFIGPVGHPKTQIPVSIQALQTLLLGVLAHMQPQFDNQGAIVGQHALEHFDLLAVQVELAGVHASVNSRLCRLGIPRAEKDADLAACRQTPPEAPEVGARFLLVGVLPIGIGLDPAGIHPLVEPLDQRAFARSDQPRDNDDDGVIPLGQVELTLQQLLSQCSRQLVEFAALDTLADFQGFEHSLPCNDPR